MARLAIIILIALLAACTPLTPKQALTTDCPVQPSVENLVSNHWLESDHIWRLRQSALLEIGRRKIPLEGFLRLDLGRSEARLLAMNEMGLVMFDLQLDQQGQILKRAIPQLKKMNGFAQGIAQSLRQIFLQPRPLSDDHVDMTANSQRLWRIIPDGSVGFTFDCLGDLRTTRLNAEEGDWRVAYDRYQDFGVNRLPGQITLNDYRNGIKLTLWMREVKQEP